MPPITGGNSRPAHRAMTMPMLKRLELRPVDSADMRSRKVRKRGMKIGQRANDWLHRVRVLYSTGGYDTTKRSPAARTSTARHAAGGILCRSIRQESLMAALPDTVSMAMFCD